MLDRKYWWVNQNKTFTQEVGGGYLWSPKVEKDGGYSQFYENMRIVSPGDVIFSFSGSRIKAIGVAQSYGYSVPKPEEFKNVGLNWNNNGWKVLVKFFKITNQIAPSKYVNVLRPLLPPKYSPLQISGRGNQKVYLTLISQRFAEILIGLIGEEARFLSLTGSVVADRPKEMPEERKDIDEYEGNIESLIVKNTEISITEKLNLVKSRRGQGLFRQKVYEYEKICRVTKVSNLAHLIASHIKPWRESTNLERLDGENGLLLTPTIDHLFDRGFISFRNTGDVLISPVADKEALFRMGVNPEKDINVGKFDDRQSQYLDFHRDKIFLTSKVDILKLNRLV